MPIDFQRVQSVFQAAAGLAPAERGAALARECGDDAELRRRVEALLRAHDDSGELPAAAPPPTGPFLPAAEPGQVFAGRYKLREQLGQGGMGVVFVADQTAPVQRRVALKVIRPGLDTQRLLARFEQERQALALMDHPNIAKVFDAGVDEGQRPYFAMELVKGLPLTRYCDDARLSPRQRLELFVPVCQAVQHAHQKGVIHRDLKPSNILVGLYDGRPVPKVIDFGVAKATGPRLTEQSVYTEVGSLVGTLEYMSPEQAELNNLDIDTRSDVYALGVILYELLTGAVPFSRQELGKAGLAEMLRVIKEREPPKPSTRLSHSGTLPSIAAQRQTEPKKLAALVRGELDWIVMKALEKDRGRRYETANGFAQDVQRYLAGEPVLAAPPSATYRLRKLVRRNRGPVLAAALVLLALVAGIVGTTFGMFRADEARGREAEQRAKAERARDRTRQALDAMTSSVTGDSLTTQQALSAEQKQFLTGVLAYYQEFAGDKADDEASRSRTAQAASRVGQIEYRLGRTTEAAAAFRQARDGYAKLAADFPAVPQYRQELALSHDNLAVQLAGLGKEAEAEQQYLKALALQEKLAADFPAVPQYRKELAASHNNLGILLRDLGKRPEAERQYRKALHLREKLVKDFPAVPPYRRDLAASHNNLGILLRDLGKEAQAEPQYRQALALQEKLAADFPAVPLYRQELAGSHHNLGFLLWGLGKMPEAEQQYRKALALKEKLADDFPAVPLYRKELAGSHHNLGFLLHDLGKMPEAEQQYRKALAHREKLVTDFPAVPAYRQVLANSHDILGLLLADLGKRPDAEQQYLKALALQEQLAADFPALPVYRKDLATSHYYLGILLADLGKGPEAERQYRKALDLREKLVKDFPAVPLYRQELATSHCGLGVLLAGQGKGSEAEQQYRKALGLQEKLVTDFPKAPAYQVELGGSYVNMGRLIRDGGQPRASLVWFAKAIRTLTAVYEQDRRVVQTQQFLRNSHLNRAMAYDRLHQFAEALQDWDRAVELSPPREQAGVRASRATARVNAGQVAEAVAEIAELTKSSAWSAGQWYDFACVYALACAKSAARKQEYADRAMELLRRAVQAGWRNAAHMRQDTDLDPLWGRDDFQQLLRELDKQPAAGPG
jgi:serine/threonine protein kinase/Flp pilus assembly protein TadD